MYYPIRQQCKRPPKNRCLDSLEV